MNSRNPILLQFLIAALCAVAALPAAASPRYAITAELIAVAVSSHGMTVSPAQVTLLSNVVSSVADPQLRVLSINRSGHQQAIARIECAEMEQCLPFFVALHTDESVDASLAAKPIQTSAASTRALAASVVRSGSKATLLLDGQHVHIALQVICLENGAPGQTILVASRDRRQTYRVQVASDGTLKGRL